MMYVSHQKDKSDKIVYFSFLLILQDFQIAYKTVGIEENMPWLALS